MLPVWPAAALLQRELRSTLRSWFPAAALAVVIVAACLCVYGEIPAEDMRIMNAASVSESIVGILCAALAGSAFLFVCPMAALSIVAERERDTLTLLHLTLIRPGGLVFAKFLNAAGFFLLLSIALLPVLGVVFFLVGVDWFDLAMRFGMVISFALYCGAIGVGCSAWMRRSIVAVIVTYIAAMLLALPAQFPEILLLIGAVGIYFAHSQSFVFFVAFVVGGTRFLHAARWKDKPPPAILVRYAIAAALLLLWPLCGLLADLYFPDAPGTGVVRGLETTRRYYLSLPERPLDMLASRNSLLFSWSLLPAPLYFLVAASIAAFVARLGMRRFQAPRQTETGRPIDNVRALAARRTRFPYYLIDPLKRKAPIPDGKNPMLVREIQWGFIGRASRMVRVFYVTLTVELILVTFVLYTSPSQWNDGMSIVLLIDLIAVAAVAPVLTAGALAREEELGNMDLLRTTLIAPELLLRGKFYAAMLGLTPIIAGCAIGPVLFFGAGAWAGSVPSSLFYAPVTGAVCVDLGLTLGLLASTVYRRTAHALMLSFVLLAMAMGLYSVCLEMVLWLDRFPVDLDIATFAAAVESVLSPVKSYLEVTGLLDNFNVHIAGADYTFLYWCLCMGVYAALSWLLFAYTVRRFSRRRMRDQ